MANEHEWVLIGEVKTSPESAPVPLEYCRHLFECPAYRYGGKVLIAEEAVDYKALAKAARVIANRTMPSSRLDALDKWAEGYDVAAAVTREPFEEAP